MINTLSRGEALKVLKNKTYKFFEKFEVSLADNPTP